LPSPFRSTKPGDENHPVSAQDLSPFMLRTNTGCATGAEPPSLSQVGVGATLASGKVVLGPAPPVGFAEEHASANATQPMSRWFMFSPVIMPVDHVLYTRRILERI
jgi:hypothetical protein